MVYEYTNDFNMTSSVGFNISNSANSGSKNPAWNIPPTTVPSAPPYPGSEAEFDAAKANTNRNSYNFFFIDGQGHVQAPKVVEETPYWKVNPNYEKQLRKNELIDGAIGLGLFLVIVCVGVFFSHRFHKRAKQEQKNLFND